jgi:hypothetical protein
MAILPPNRLHRHQSEFLQGFLERNDSRTLLVAPPGTGKTLVARVAAARMLEAGLADRVLLIAGHRALLEQWRESSAKGEEGSLGPASPTLAVTYSELSHEPERIWGDMPPATRWLFLFDGIEWAADRLEAIAAKALLRFPGSRALFIARDAPPMAVDAQFAFTYEFFGRDALAATVTQSGLTRLAPSPGLLQRVQRKLIQLEDLSWREFELLIAQMLKNDGYQVELMQGSKDGGVDVVAIRDMGNAGLFKSVWQAKKNRSDRKVGLSVVRELADTRLEHGASKAVIVTTSYLTSGALDRVERDRYLLGKVDRGDLDRWIERTLRNG